MHTREQSVVAVVLMGGYRSTRSVHDVPVDAPVLVVADIGGSLVFPPDDLSDPGAGEVLKRSAGFWEAFRLLTAEQAVAAGAAAAVATRTPCYGFMDPDPALSNFGLFRQVNPSTKPVAPVSQGGRP